MDYDSGEFDMISAGFGVCGTIDSYLPQSPISAELISPTANMCKSSPSAVSFLPGSEITYFETDQSADSIALVQNEEIISSVVEEVVKSDDVTQPASDNLSVK